MKRPVMFLVLVFVVSHVLAEDDSAPSERPNAVVTEDREARRPELAAFAVFSERLLADLIKRDVRVKHQVAESILNMWTRGTASADCHISLEFVPNSSRANIRITMKGEAVVDDGVSTMRSVSVYSRSRTSINGYKDIFLQPEGLTMAPTDASCRTWIRVIDIEAPRRLIERLAWRRAGNTRSEVEQAASRSAERRAEEQLESETHQPLTELQSKYAKNVFEPLSEQKTFPKVHLATTDEHLSISFLRDALPTDEVSVNRSSPPAPAFDASMCLHDTSVNEMVERWMPGVTITDEHFANALETITGKIPRPLWIHERAERWSIHCTEQSPIRFAFRDETLSITFHVDRIIRDERALDHALTIAAHYSLDKTADGPHLIRVGVPEVSFASSEDAELKRFLERKFNGVLPSELYFDGLTPPEGGTWGKLRRLELTQLSSRDGWLAIGYVLTPAVTDFAHVKNTK